MSARLFYVHQDVTRLYGDYFVCAVVRAAGPAAAVRAAERSCRALADDPDGHGMIEFRRERVEARVLAERFEAAVATNAADRFGVLCLMLGRDDDL